MGCTKVSVEGATAVFMPLPCKSQDSLRKSFSWPVTSTALTCIDGNFRARPDVVFSAMVVTGCCRADVPDG